MENSTLEKMYNNLLEINKNYSSKEYVIAMNDVIIYVTLSCDSISIKNLLVKEVKNKFSSDFPVWLELLLFKIYVLKNPKDKEMYDLGVNELWRHSAESDISVIESSLLQEP